MKALHGLRKCVGHEAYGELGLRRKALEARAIKFGKLLRVGKIKREAIRLRSSSPART